MCPLNEIIRVIQGQGKVSDLPRDEQPFRKRTLDNRPYRRLPGPGALSVVVRPTLQLVPVDLRNARDPLLLYLLQCPRPMFHCLLVHPRQDIWMWMELECPKMVMVFVAIIICF